MLSQTSLMVTMVREKREGRKSREERLGQASEGCNYFIFFSSGVGFSWVGSDCDNSSDYTLTVQCVFPPCVS